MDPVLILVIAIGYLLLQVAFWFRVFKWAATVTATSRQSNVLAAALLAVQAVEDLSDRRRIVDEALATAGPIITPDSSL